MIIGRPADVFQASTTSPAPPNSADRAAMSTARLRSDQVRDHAARSMADDAIHFVRPLLEEICRQAGQPRDVTVRPEPDIRCRAAVRPDVLDIPRPAPRRVHHLARPSRPTPCSPSAHIAPGHHPTASALVLQQSRTANPQVSETWPPRTHDRESGLTHMPN